MSYTFEKTVKGATKIKMAPPKAKYTDRIISATYAGENGIAEIFRTLQLRLRDSTWTIVFKALIVVHLMISDGQKDETLEYLSQAPEARLSTNDFTVVQTQGDNIQRYADYLVARANGYAATRQDYARPGAVTRIKTVTIAKGLLKETESIEDQLKALLECRTINNERANQIASTASLLLYNDLVALYGTLNQAVMTILLEFFKLSNVDAKQAVRIYKEYVAQTTSVIRYLDDIRRNGHIPTNMLPSISLANAQIIRQLELHVKDPDFDLIRMQHLDGQHDNKKKFPRKTADNAKIEETTTESIKAPAPDLIDFFDSIEQSSQQPLTQAQPQINAFTQQPPIIFQNAPQQQQFSYAPQEQSVQLLQATNPFAQQMPSNFPPPIQPQYTYAPPAEYTQFPPVPHLAMQPTAQAQYLAPQATLSPQTTNPFRQSMMMTGQSPFQIQPVMDFPLPTQQYSGPAVNLMETVQSQSILQPQRTGTNPFAKSPASPLPPSPSTLQPMVTGSTNPFRQSQFINQETGRGWQTGVPQGTMGGLEQLQTVPVFPRPGQ